MKIKEIKHSGHVVHERVESEGYLFTFFEVWGEDDSLFSALAGIPKNAEVEVTIKVKAV